MENERGGIGRKVIESLTRVSLLDLVAFSLLIVDNAHSGRLFADREVSGQAWVGYLFGGALVLMAQIAFSTLALVEGTKRGFAVVVFGVAIFLPGFLSSQYYRGYAPDDPVWFSWALGFAPAVLAALAGGLKAMGDRAKVEQESTTVLALRKMELDAETAKAVGVEREKTKQAKARAAVATIKAQADQQKQDADKGLSTSARRTRVLAMLGDNPSLSNANLGQVLGTSRETIRQDLVRLVEAGKITVKGTGRDRQVFVKVGK